MGSRLVDKLIWKELLGPLLNSIFLFVIILFTSTYLIKVTDLMVRGASPLVVGKVALFSLPMLITQTLPMGMLLGTILAFGRLSGDSEHIALYASGVSFFRIARPVAWLGIFVGIVTIAWNETIVPPSTRELYKLMGNAIEDISAKPQPIRYDLKRKGTDEVEQIVYIHGGYDPKSHSLRKVTILRFDANGSPEMSVSAENAVAKDATGTTWKFFNVNVWYMKTGERPQNTANVYLDEATVLPQKVTLGKDFKGIVAQENTDNRQLTFRELRDKINQKRAQSDTTYLGDEFDLWAKIALPLASVIFGLVAAPLGLRPQRSSRTTMGFGIAIMIIFLYWFVHQWMYQVGKGGTLPPFVAAFTADVIGMVTAVVLIARTRQ